MNNQAIDAEAEAEACAFWQKLYTLRAEREAQTVIRAGLAGLSSQYVYDQARRAHRSAITAALHAGNDLRDLTEEEQAAKDARTCCGECGQEV